MAAGSISLRARSYYIDRWVRKSSGYRATVWVTVWRTSTCFARGPSSLAAIRQAHLVICIYMPAIIASPSPLSEIPNQHMRYATIRAKAVISMPFVAAAYDCAARSAAPFLRHLTPPDQYNPDIAIRGCPQCSSCLLLWFSRPCLRLSTRRSALCRPCTVVFLLSFPYL